VAANLIWNNYDVLLADLDGVVYEGSKPIRDAVASINELQATGVQVGYVTNNSSRKQSTIAEQLREFGLSVQPKDIFSSGKIAVDLLQTKISAGAKVFVVGGEGLRSFVADAGFEIVTSSEDGPSAVIQGFAPDVSWKDLAEAAYSIQRGAVWIATNNDWTLPQERGIAPGNGTLVSAVHTAVGDFPIFAGKPEPAIFQAAALGMQAKRAFFVGDRLETDILGANQAKLDSAVVLTGIASKKDVLAARAEERPTYVLETLADLLQDYPVIKETKRGFSCGEAQVELLANKVLVVAGQPTSMNAFRAACKVIWNADRHIHFLEVQKELYL
jgi:HAD superfamily hydrolase (TIGR01450 family)